MRILLVEDDDMLAQAVSRALSTHGRTGLKRLLHGSVAETILRKSRLPLLVVRATAEVRPHPLHARAGRVSRKALAIEPVGLGEAKGPYNR